MSMKLFHKAWFSVLLPSAVVMILFYIISYIYNFFELADTDNTVLAGLALFASSSLFFFVIWDYFLTIKNPDRTISNLCRLFGIKNMNNFSAGILTGLIIGVIIGLIIGFICGHLFWYQTI